MKFYVGCGPDMSWRFPRSFISVNKLRRLKTRIYAQDWIMDSGAFTEISTHGQYRHDVSDYAREIRRWTACNHLELVVAQDWMCEPFIIARTGLTILEHQRLTTERYDALVDEDTGGVPVMPVLQGFAAEDYLRHIDQYGDRLKPGQRVGIGSVCKRNTSVDEIEAVIGAIHGHRPDLLYRGFGIKKTSLYSPLVREWLYSSDSFAWSFAARKAGEPQTWHAAEAYRQDVEEILAGRPQRRRGLAKNNPLRGAA